MRCFFRITAMTMMRIRKDGIKRMIWLFFAGLSLSCCHAPDSADQADPSDDVSRLTDVLGGPSSDGRLSVFSSRLSLLLSDKIQASLDAEGHVQQDTSLEARLSAWTSLFPDLKHDQLIAALYPPDKIEGHMRFVLSDGSLTSAGQVILDTVGRADDHALSSSSFGFDAIHAALERYRKLMALDIGIRLSSREMGVLERVLRTSGIQARGEVLTAEAFEKGEMSEAFETLLDGLTDMETSPLPRVAAAYRTWHARKKYLAAYRLRLEYALAGMLLDWAETFRLGDTEQFSKEELAKYATEDAPNDIHPKYYDDIVQTRLHAFFASIDADAAWDADTLKARLDGLLPSHLQYERLQKVRERYRRIVKEGGWEELKPDNLNFGGSAPLVRALKKRLAQEGYYDGEINDHYDAPLKKGITAYQVHHQLDVTDQLDKTFWKSLNVRAEQRLSEIEVNLRRWHHTRYVPRDRYIYINIPSFTAELWDAGRRVATHKVIVGSSTKICNARTREWELMNATRLLHARMTYIVFNPYWNVPPRIEVDEYHKKMAEDPKWLENSDFEYYTPKGGGRVLRQKPGPNNALGKVKLIFPNRYNIYLHDTPQQPMFGYTVRAFSHGCMRVQNAMGLAQSILTVDGQWDPAKVKRYFVEKGEHAVDLVQPIDVFIEYYTVTVDDEGKPYFLADVYRIIKDQLDPPTPRERACDPSVDRVSSFRSGGVPADAGP